jgi:chaperonin GroES
MPEVPPAHDPASDPAPANVATARGSTDASANVTEAGASAAASPNGKAHAARLADVRLTGDRLVVRPPGDGERTTNSGLLIPATAAPAPKRLTWGDVALAGPDVRVAKVGDRVLFLPQSGLEVELDGEELVLLRERDVQAVSSAPTSPAERQPGQYL